MKRACVYVLLILSVALLLSGCGIEMVDEGGTRTMMVSLIPGENKKQDGTAAPKETKPPVQTPPAPQSPATEAPATDPAVTGPKPAIYLGRAVPYVLDIDRVDQPIHEGPGYDYAFVDTIHEKGSYTVVQEIWDNDGNCWGKLKSGAGWVDVTEILGRNYTIMPMSVSFADEHLLFHGDYYHCVSTTKEYCIPVVFRAYEKLKDAAVFAYDISGETYTACEPFFKVKELTPDMPLVAELAFSDEKTMFGIRFTDEEGHTHIYSMHISEKSDALVLVRHQ